MNPGLYGYPERGALNVAAPSTAPSLAKAFVSFNGTGSPGIISASNVKSVERIEVGHYKVNFAKPLDDADYGAVFGTQRTAANDPFFLAVVGMGQHGDFTGSTMSIGDQPYGEIDLFGQLDYGHGDRGVGGIVNAPAGTDAIAIFGLLLPDLNFTFVSCNVELFTNSTTPGKAIGCLMTDYSNWLSIGVYDHTGSIKVHYNGAEVFDGSAFGLPIHLRLRKGTGTAYIPEWSSDNVIWNPTGSHDPGVLFPRCGLSCATFSGAAASYPIAVADYATDDTTITFDAKTAEYCCIETCNPMTGEKVDASVVNAAFYE